MEIESLPVGLLKTNCYIVYDHPGGEGYVVDPGDDADVILQTVQTLSLRVLGVVLTHAHCDHMLAVQDVCRATGAPVWVGAGDAPAMTDPLRNLSVMFGLHPPVQISAARLLREGDALPLGEETLTVLETPGHTPGCLCLDSGCVLISGDTLFASTVGRTDVPGGDTAALQRSIARLAALEGDRRVYPGHGKPTTLNRERMSNPMMQSN